MTEVYKLLGIKKLNTSAYHPQTDGLTEKFNQTLAKILSKYINFSQNDWDFYIPYALFAYRTSVHASTHMTPFFMLYGREARLPAFIFKSLPKNLLPEGYGIHIKDLMGSVWKKGAQILSKQKKYNRRFMTSQHQMSVMRQDKLSEF